MLIGPTLIEGVERTNKIMVHPNQWAVFVPHNLYMMNMDRGRNCYSCGGFGYLAQNFGRQIIDQRRSQENEDN